MATQQISYNTSSIIVASQESISNAEPIAQVALNFPGSIQFSAQRYEQAANWEFDSKASIIYSSAASTSSAKNLQLSFCIQGKIYCNQSDKRCASCHVSENGCDSEMPTLDVLQLQFSEKYLQQFLNTQENSIDLLSTLSKETNRNISEKNFTVSTKLKTAISALLSNSYEGTLGNIFVNAQLQMVLLYSLESHSKKQEEPIFVCKFLANTDDRKKIMAARDVLLKNINTPITIKQLSRKVGINECYLKKGFKEVFGSTIFEFYQTQRMEHAKYLLYEKGLSVTEVSDLLGYSSISHFSTAFKKQTGIKPCELLNR